MAPDSNQWRRRWRGQRQKKPRGPNPKARPSQPNCRCMGFRLLRCNGKILLNDISRQPSLVIVLTSSLRPIPQVAKPHEFVRGGRGGTFGARVSLLSLRFSALERHPMAVQVTPHPHWVADLAPALDH